MSHVRATKDENFKYPIFANALKNNGLYGYSDIYKIDCDCVTVSGRGDIGVAHARKGRFYPIVRLLVLTPKQTVSTIYFENAINIMKVYCESTGVPQLTAPQLNSYKILLPPLPEQQKIAEVLSTWDKAIEKQSQLVEKLELRKKGLMQQLLTGKKRLPGFSGEWKKVKLGDIGSFFKGFGVPKNEISEYGKYKCLTYGDLYTKYDIKIDNVKTYISQDVANISQEIRLGDICFAGSGETKEDIGKCAVFVDGEIGYAGGDIIIFRNEANINPLVLSYILNSEYVNKQKSSLGQGHSVVHIYISQLELIRIKLPCLEEQNAIAEILSSCDKEISLANRELDTLRKEKKGLMQVLLTGKKRIV